MYFDEQSSQRLTALAIETENGFMGQHQYYKRFVAVLTFALEKEFHAEQVKEISDYIKTSTKLFSPLRANRYLLSSLLMLKSKKPKQAVDRILDHLDHLKQAGFRKTNHLPMMSYCLDSLLFNDDYYDQMKQTGSYIDDLIDETRKTYLGMRENHPWITGGEDYPLALLISYNEKDSEEIEHIYETLVHLGLKKGNELQNLANIISLSEEESTVICNRVFDFIEYSVTKGFKVNRSMYAGIGLISLLGKDTNYLDQVLEAATELKGIKKFKWLEKHLLFLFAVAIVTTQVQLNIQREVALNTTIAITIEQLITAQIAVMMGMIAATTAASSAAN